MRYRVLNEPQFHIHSPYTTDENWSKLGKKQERSIEYQYKFLVSYFLNFCFVDTC